MRRKRKTHWEIQCPDLWYSYEFKKWVEFEDIGTKGGSTSQYVKFAKKAKKIMMGLPSGTLLRCWYWHRGIRYCKEWLRK